MNSLSHSTRWNMRQVHGYPPGQVREYTVKIDDSIKVWIKSPTEGEKRRLSQEGEVIRFDTETGMVVDVGMLRMDRIVAKHERFVRGFVEKVEGYTNAAGVPIVNGDDLAEHGDNDIVAEVALEVEKSLSLGAEAAKKSDASPG